jgi:energy-coupling factor transporter transmembrane protein EcfT
MAELTAFGYRSGRTFFHRRDVRFKLAVFVTVTLATLNMGPTALALLLAGVALILRTTGSRLKPILRELRYFLWLLLFVFCARTLSTEGVSLITIYGIPITREGVQAGLTVCLRLGTTVLASLIIVSTTRTAEIRAAVSWLLRPLPGVAGKRIATMIGLLVRFIPVIFLQARLVSDAQRARAVENRKNPLYRLPRYTVPLMRRTFLTADRLAVAMEARCFSYDRTEPTFSATAADWFMLLAAAGLNVGLLLCR